MVTQNNFLLNKMSGCRWHLWMSQNFSSLVWHFWLYYLHWLQHLNYIFGRWCCWKHFLILIQIVQIILDSLQKVNINVFLHQKCRGRNLLRDYNKYLKNRISKLPEEKDRQFDSLISLLPNDSLISLLPKCLGRCFRELTIFS